MSIHLFVVKFNNDRELLNLVQFDQLTDFGLSKIGLMNCTAELSTQEKEKNDILDTHDQMNADTVDSHQSQSAVGTPDYLAPEILLGSEHGRQLSLQLAMCD